MICIVLVVVYIKLLVLTVQPQEKVDFPFSLFFPNCHQSLFIPSYIALIAVVCLTGVVIGTDPETVCVQFTGMWHLTCTCRVSRRPDGSWKLRTSQEACR